MKKIVLFIVCIFCTLSPLSIVAQADYQIPESAPANNGELDWLVYKDRTGEAKTEKKDILLKSNLKSLYFAAVSQISPAMTYAKVPINMNGDFYLSATLKPAKVDDKHLIGMVFNVASEGDYNAIVFDGQFCSLVRVQLINGVYLISGMEQRLRYKYQKSKKGTWTISLDRKNGADYVFSLNGLEVMTFPKSTVFSFPSVGACVTNKSELKITEVSYCQWASPTEAE